MMTQPLKYRTLIISLLFGCLQVSGSMAWAVAPSSAPDTLLADEQAELQLLYGGKDLVTATKRSTPLRNAPAIATVITADEIRNMGARNLLDVLKMVPGIGISTTEYGSNMIEVRGIRTTFNEKILLLIDGHSMNKTSSGSGLYLLADTLPVENIKQIEVVRGPGSALYGSNAFMATVNIITRDADDIDGLEAKISGGSFDTFKGTLTGAVEYGDRLAASGSFDIYRTNGPKLRIESDVLRSTAFSNAPGTVHLDVEQTEGFLKLLYGDFTFRGHYLGVKKGFFIGMGYALTNDTQNYYDTDNYWGELAYSRKIATTLSATLKVSYDHYQQQPYVKSLPDGYNNSFPEGKIGHPLVQDQSINAELQLDWDPFPGNHIIAGVVSESMKQYDVRRIANFNPLTGAYLGSLQEVANWNKDAERQTTSLYLQDEWRLLDKVALTAGVRYDHYSDFGGTVNPRAGLVWNALDNVDLKLLYGQAFRAPSFVEMYNINTVSNAGNPNLKPERIATYEASAAVRFSRAFNLDLNYFYSAIDDLIVRDGSVTPTSFNNAGKAVTQGVEAGLHGAFDLLQWKTTYAWQAPRDDLTKQRLAYVPTHRATASLSYALTRYLNLHSDLRWTGPRPRDTGDTRGEMPDYTTVDLALTAHNFLEGLEIQVAVFNLFDKRYSDPDTSGAAQKIPGDFPREGISLQANLLYKF
jgi:iron complex outermembrane receptor protein